MQEPANKVVVITGAAKGLGRALAKRFSISGFHLALIDVDNENLAVLKIKLSTSNRVSIHKADVSNEHDVEQALNYILLQHKRIDILINNAAISSGRMFESTSLEKFRKVIDVNFYGTVNCCKIFLPRLKLQQNSKIVNIVSGFATMGFPGKTAYSSSKGAITSFTNSLRTELANVIDVILVIPPALKTTIVQNGDHIDDLKKGNENRYLHEKGMDVDKAASIIFKNVIKGKFRIVIEWKMYFLDLFSRLFPRMLSQKIIRRRDKFDFI